MTRSATQLTLDIANMSQRARPSDQDRAKRPARPCRFFNTSRGCDKGDDCTYLHVNEPATGVSSMRCGVPPAPATRPGFASRKLLIVPKSKFHDPRSKEACGFVEMSELPSNVYHSATIDGLVSARYAQDASTVSRRIKTFCNPVFAFHNNQAMFTFCELLLSCNMFDKRWVGFLRSTNLACRIAVAHARLAVSHRIRSNAIASSRI